MPLVVTRRRRGDLAQRLRDRQGEAGGRLRASLRVGRIGKAISVSADDGDGALKRPGWRSRGMT